MKTFYVQSCNLLVFAALFLSCIHEIAAQNHLGHPALIAQTVRIPCSEPLWVPTFSDPGAASSKSPAQEQITVFEELTSLEAFIIPLALPEGKNLAYLSESSLLINPEFPLPAWMEYYSYDHSLKGMPPVGSDGSLIVELTFSSPQGPLSYKLFVFVQHGVISKPLGKDGLSYVRP